MTEQTNSRSSKVIVYNILNLNALEVGPKDVIM